MARFPLLAIDELERWAQRRRGTDGGDAQLPSAALEDGLREIVRRPEVQQAIFLSSPSIHEAVGAWLRGEETRRAAECVPAVARYVQRMAARPTPFGTMAGVALGRVGRTTRLQVASRDEARTRTRLDMRFFEQLGDAWAADHRVVARARFRAPDSAFLVGDRVSFVERRSTSDGVSYQSASVRSTPAIRRILEAARLGRTLAELTAVLREVVPGIADDAARDYLLRLAAAGLLVPEVGTPVVTTSSVADLRRIADDCGPDGAAAALGDGERALLEIDRQGIGADVGAYSELAARLAPLVGEAPRFHVDVVREADVEVASQLARQVAEAVELTRRCFPTPPADPLSSFREAFVERWQDREIALVRALDPEVGIGFGGGGEPLVPSFVSEAPRAREGRGVELQPHHVWLLERLGGLARPEALDLDEAAVGELTGLATPRRLPGSLVASIRLIGSPEEAGREESLVHLVAWAGPSTGRLLGRFAGLDEQLEQAIRRQLGEDDDRVDAVVADVDFAPAGRIANVVVRVPLRRHRIPILSRAPIDEWTIPPSDLLVSVHGDEVRLRSARLGREVLPRLSTAHRYSSPRQPPLYRFLGALEEQSVTGGWQWSWGPLGSMPSLPLVRRGRFVLAPRQWRFKRGALAGCSSDIELLRVIDAWRRSFDPPRWVCLKEGDQELPVDLDNPISVLAFARVARRRSDCVMVEMLQHAGRAPARGVDGAYATELLVPFLAPSVERASLTPPIGSTRARRHVPGGEWTYAKVYAGPATLDHLLLDRIGPAVQELTSSGDCDRWFFLRYRDPEPHIRLRLRLGAVDEVRPGRLARVVERLREMVEPVDDAVARLVLDTYDPEIERYGGERGVDLAERFFHVDSEFVLSCSKALGGARVDPEARFLATLRGVHQLLDLCLGQEGTLEVVERMRDSYAVEQGLSTVEGRRALSAAYRRVKDEVAASVEGRARDDRLVALDACFAERAARLGALVVELRAGCAGGEIVVPLHRFAGSLAHMHASRALRSALRRQEAFMYDMLSRALVSRRFSLIRPHRVP